MRKHRTKERRLSGRHITLIAIAVCVTLAPTAVYAAERMISIIGDPYNSSALARVSEDGRLGVRGEATSQQGVPSNEWHRALTSRPDDYMLVRAAPPGTGIGVSQFTLGWNRRGTHSAAHLWWTASSEECPRAWGALSEDRPPGELLGTVSRAHASESIGIEQTVFPVPLTIPPSPDKNICLYVFAFTWTSEGRREASIQVNGIGGATTPPFVPAKGEQSTTPGGGTGDETSSEDGS